MNKLFVRKKKDEKISGRITDATVEEHREKILAKGRKFKYPLQYSKHRALINTAIIGAVAAVLFCIVAWLDLYVWRDTGDVAYGLTRILPVPVASIDGENVRFSDYLMIFRSSVTSIERQQGSLDQTEEETGVVGGDVVRRQYMRQALTDAQRYAYALKLARELEIKVTQAEMAEMTKVHRTVGGVEKSEDTYEKILRDNFGLSVSEYERLLTLVLTRRKVEERIDERALNLMNETVGMLAENGGNMEATAREGVNYEVSGGLVDGDNLDGGRTKMARSLEVGQLSEKFVSQNGDGYYIVKLTEKKDTQVAYESVFVRFTEFERRIGEMRGTCETDDSKVIEFIDVGGLDGTRDPCYIFS